MGLIGVVCHIVVEIAVEDLGRTEHVDRRSDGRAFIIIEMAGGENGVTVHVVDGGGLEFGIEITDNAIVESHLAVDDFYAAEGEEDASLDDAGICGILEADAGLRVGVFVAFVDETRIAGGCPLNGQCPLDGQRNVVEFNEIIGGEDEPVSRGDDDITDEPIDRPVHAVGQLAYADDASVAVFDECIQIESGSVSGACPLGVQHGNESE